MGNLLIKVNVLPSSAQEMTTQNVRAVVEVVCLGEWKVQHRFRIGDVVCERSRMDDRLLPDDTGRHGM